MKKTGISRREVLKAGGGLLAGSAFSTRVLADAPPPEPVTPALIEAARKEEMMRRSLAILAGGTAALTLALPVSVAYARPVTAVKVPKAGNSRYVVGYAQVGCGRKGYPQYVQILGDITVPKATDADGTPGNSTDYYTLRPGRNPNGASTGVAAGVAVLTDAGTSFIYAYGLWHGLPIARASFPVQSGDKLQVEIQNRSEERRVGKECSS